MSLNYRLSGLPCVFCDRPVDRIHVYANAVVAVHESPHQPDCVFVHTAEVQAGGQQGSALAHVPLHPGRGVMDTPIHDQALAELLAPPIAAT